MKTPLSKPGFQYFEANIAFNNIVVNLHTIPDFVRYAEQHGTKSIFLINDDADEKNSHFALINNGLLIRQYSFGFKFIEDFQEAKRQGFNEAQHFYDAKVRGVTHYKDYQLMLDARIVELSVLETLKTLGYAEGFEAWQKLQVDASLKLPDIGSITNAYELYEVGVRQGFPSYALLETALLIGFDNHDNYLSAINRGFKDAASFEDAVKLGFICYSDYEFALIHQIRDTKDATHFFSFCDAAGGKEIPFDEKVMLSFLSRLEEGKRISINKIIEHCRGRDYM